MVFGYVTVDRSEMLGKDFEAYKAVYCSLCKQLGKEYTFLSRLILSYDCTFYALVAMSLEPECSGFTQGRCKVNPLKKCNYIKAESKALSMAAALSVVSVYYKLKDNIADGGFFEKLGCYMLLPLFSHWRKKAAKKYPDIDTAVGEMLKHQFQVEKDSNCSIDKAAEPTALMLSSVIALLATDECKNKAEKERIFRAFGYFLGRWIYLIDAANDYQSDLKHKNFNPYVIKYADKDCVDIDEINESLNCCLTETLLSYGLMDVKRFDRIIENILIHGMTRKQKEILYKEKH